MFVNSVNDCGVVDKHNDVHRRAELGTYQRDWSQQLNAWPAHGETPETSTVKCDPAKWVPEYSDR